MGVIYIGIAVKLILSTLCIMLFFHVHDMEKGRKKLWRMIVGSIICCLGLLGATVFPVAIGIKLIIVLLCITVSMFLWKRFRFMRTFYLALFFCFLYFATRVLAGAIAEGCVGSPVEAVTDIILPELLSAGILVLIIGGIRYVHVSYKEGVSLKRQWLSFFIIMVNAMLLMLEGMQIISVGEKTEILFLIFHLMCICFCGYVLVTDYGKKQVAYLSSVVNAKSSYANTGADDLEEIITVQRKKAHEYRNHIYCIYHLAQREGCREIVEFIKDLDYGMYENAPLIFVTGNEIVDVILNAKYMDAKSAGIDISMCIEPLGDVFMRKEDLSVLFSNLLNNAMEAAGTCKGSKEVRVEVKMWEGRLFVMVANTHSNMIAEDDGKIFTTKSENPAEHGYGLSNIKEIVARYNGECHITYTENEFRIQVLI